MTGTSLNYFFLVNAMNETGCVSSALLVVVADLSRWISRRGPENVLEARLFSYKACAIFWPKFIPFHMASALRLSIETRGFLHSSVSTWSFRLGLYGAVICR